MIKKITKIGNSQGIIFDQTLMDMAHLKVGDEVNVTIHDGGSVTLTPSRPHISVEKARETARSFIQQNDELFKALS